MGSFVLTCFGLHEPGKQHVILRKEVAGAKIRLHVQEELPLLRFTQCSPFAYLTYLGLEECFKSPSWSLAFGGSAFSSGKQKLPGLLLEYSLF